MHTPLSEVAGSECSKLSCLASFAVKCSEYLQFWEGNEYDSWNYGRLNGRVFQVLDYDKDTGVLYVSHLPVVIKRSGWKAAAKVATWVLSGGIFPLLAVSVVLISDCSFSVVSHDQLYMKAIREGNLTLFNECHERDCLQTSRRRVAGGVWAAFWHVKNLCAAGSNVPMEMLTILEILMHESSIDEVRRILIQAVNTRILSLIEIVLKYKDLAGCTCQREIKQLFLQAELQLVDQAFSGMEKEICKANPSIPEGDFPLLFALKLIIHNNTERLYNETQKLKIIV
ncbi:MAG: hypothetical protein P4L16_06435 [Chlamydiales bacterium]|nr:hypothetical protein [Chlamydiales bacterium]